MPIHHLSQNGRHLVGLQVRTCDFQLARGGMQVVIVCDQRGWQVLLQCRLLEEAHLFSQSERPVQSLPDHLRRDDKGPQATSRRHTE